jgi:hypothetical protein
MQSAYRSKKSAEVTDEVSLEKRIMTHNFLKIFYSGLPTSPSASMPDDRVYTLVNAVLVSYKTHNDYKKWLTTMPSLLKELV